MNTNLENIIFDAQNNIFGAQLDDYLYNLYLSRIAEYKGDENSISFYKHRLINRLKVLIKGEEYNASDFIDESVKMWEELYSEGYSSKEQLDLEDYPLSTDQYFDIGCALCNYSIAVSRVENHCEKCPVKWINGTCHNLYYKWEWSETESEHKINAKALLDEIKNGRID